MSDVNIKSGDLFKECTGKECHNQGRVNLKIKFIKKLGLFCESCTLELKALDLIDEENLGGIKES
jgi:hypothetical protein